MRDAANLVRLKEESARYGVIVSACKVVVLNVRRELDTQRLGGVRFDTAHVLGELGDADCRA